MYRVEISQSKGRQAVLLAVFLDFRTFRSHDIWVCVFTRTFRHIQLTKIKVKVQVKKVRNSNPHHIRNKTTAWCSTFRGKHRSAWTPGTDIIASANV